MLQLRRLQCVASVEGSAYLVIANAEPSLEPSVSVLYGIWTYTAISLGMYTSSTLGSGFQRRSFHDSRAIERDIERDIEMSFH